MHYRLTIGRIIENPNYETELEAFQRSERFGRNVMDLEGSHGPQRFIEQQHLFTIIDEEQFKAIQKACIETMK